MKTIGVIGGMSWESSAAYYKFLNEAVAARLGGLHSARLIMDSVDFAEIEQMQRQDRWADAGAVLAASGRRLEQAGAQLLLLGTNTMHKVADAISSAVSIPFLHIADPTAGAIREAGLRKVGLLGTAFTMEQNFYKGRLTGQHGLAVIVPGEDDRREIHRIIFQELCLGKLLPSSREYYRAAMDRLVAAGAEGIILGCTEIGLLVGPEDASVPLFDTCKLHAEAAVDLALREAQ